MPQGDNLNKYVTTVTYYYHLLSFLPTIITTYYQWLTLKPLVQPLTLIE